ncbi:Arylesterase [Alteripontixanthobacter maritimus]|uniref:Arylesterase n=1 Tax=Alteripontixanthobacter maritimus TaxID=2161824 RepID=A0A369Q9C1_9SPHN|nr:arylesterase [Alteripontixanthobacter maritimus]RDC59509.1 Arylesterase [Alteripontixanthobacter maritimus]
MKLSNLAIARCLSSIAMCAALAACDENAGDAVAEPTAAREQVADDVSQPVMGPQRQVLAFGNSLFAGYRVPAADAYPAKLQNALRARGINAQVVNAGVSGDTTAAGLQRFAFTLNAQDTPPELVILELGGNDLLRNLPPEATRANLAAMLDELKKRDIPAILFGMRAPPNLGPDYVAQYDALYRDLAEQYGAALVPFFLEPVYDQPRLIQPDRIHPTTEGIEALVAYTADDVAEALPDAAK